MTSPNGYGTLDGTQSSWVTTASGNEQSPLLAKTISSPRSTRVSKYLKQEIDRRRADLVLLLSYVITGLLDSSAVFIWGSFVSMQTGNTVYLGLGLVAPTEGTRWIRSGTSIGFFCAGSFFFSRFHRYFAPKRRWVLLASFSAQLVLVTSAAIIVHVDAERGGDLRWEVLVPLALVAFQSSGQAVTSRALQYSSLTSVVLTSIYCDLFSDPLIMAGLTQNDERNRRAAAPVLLLLGAMVGGLWAHSSVGLSGALWTAATMKIIIILAWCFWKAEPGSDSNDDNQP
ncbi:uncharacterized protein A1O9_10588 [Exophiala aquamarina CBS 119918]|uniref:DUF1275 domain protein n=1 Tax=Exophiala aquamarina CBS 119918 TaxID=1182545 RepID=A0A072P2X2_9EURO|nr:uncharacterized protein A1O9_10588 [Exophiala aquamarina CBS 119918]KEF53613.1 hypothetical protein A1O9_10588 [Exophiala aquamarina CBS 119918]